MVAESYVTMLRPSDCWRPMWARYSPMPADVASMTDLGMARMIRVRTPVTARMTKMNPSMKTAARAVLYATCTVARLLSRSYQKVCQKVNIKLLKRGEKMQCPSGNVWYAKCLVADYEVWIIVNHVCQEADVPLDDHGNVCCLSCMWASCTI